jgi:hypothetical protein
MPLLSKDGKNKPNSGYFSMSVGGASDKSNDGILNNTLGLLGISYAVPIGQHETYLAVGFQGEYYQSILNVAGVSNAFGDQFNAYGPIEGAAQRRPSCQRLVLRALQCQCSALSVFSNGRYDKWYFGGSVQQVNQPYEYDIKSDSTRLKPDVGFQGGYRYITTD